MRVFLNKTIKQPRRQKKHNHEIDQLLTLVTVTAKSRLS